MSDIDSAAERERLEGVAADSWYAERVNAAGIRYGGKIFARHWRGGRCLELGPAEGLMTERLVQDFDSVVLVDGSERFCAMLRERYPGADVVLALFEEYEPQGTFDAIVLGHVLEHVADPVALLRRVAPWLCEGGSIYAAVPNARSLHRQAAVLMGLLETEHTFNEADRHHGHRRLYDPETLRADFLQAGLRIDVFGGYWLKPLSIRQIAESWTPEMLDAFMALGERYPDVAGEIYVIASCPPR
jgi:2-polyprenyl-3-methyl-5-hydroxy-6-metoxy-1,4-benzoquinol methylase